MFIHIFSKKMHILINSLELFYILYYREERKMQMRSSDLYFHSQKKEVNVMQDYLVEIKQVTKKFHKQKALNQVSLNIPKNCVYGLLGPNGAGKSTLLKSLTGIMRPTEGKILFDGHLWSRKDLNEIGALVETPPIYENLSAWENLKVRALLLGLPDGRIEEVLRIVGLENTGRKKAGAFSLGMKQRLGIAIALLNHPKLLVLDEPVNGLDPVGIQELREMIRKFPEEGITVLISSHILSEIEQTADYIGIIVEGEMHFEGSISECDNLEELFMEIVKKQRKEGIR